MRSNRRAACNDGNQKEIVKALRELGASVETGHDDILVGYQGKTYWYELKATEKSKLRPHQEELLATWKGHYKVAWTLEMILTDMGVIEHA